MGMHAIRVKTDQLVKGCRMVRPLPIRGASALGYSMELAPVAKRYWFGLPALPQGRDRRLEGHSSVVAKGERRPFRRPSVTMDLG